jgi:hypothetical protein
MATTTLKIKTESDEQKLMFMTAETGENIIVVTIYKTDDEYNPTGTGSMSVAQYPTEEAYHKDLRKQASEKGQYVPEYSTNPEWNPGYVEPQDDDYEFQGDLYQ